MLVKDFVSYIHSDKFEWQVVTIDRILDKDVEYLRIAVEMGLRPVGAGVKIISFQRLPA